MTKTVHCWHPIVGMIIATACAQPAATQSKTPVVQVVENRARLAGRVTVVATHPSIAGHDLVTVAADTVADVPGYPNLVRQRAAEPIPVTIAHERVAALGLVAGDRVAMVVRLGGPTSVIADPDSIEKR